MLLHSSVRSAVRVACLLLGWFSLSACCRADLVWSRPIQDFQTTPDQSSVEAHFAFKNTGKSTVSIKSLKTSCGCTTASLEKKVYAPGEEGEVVATYKFPFQKGALRKLVTVTTDASPEPVVLDIRVFVQEPFELKPALLVWRTGAAAEAKSTTLSAKGDHPVHIRSIASSNPRLTATLQTVRDGEEYIVNVTPADTAQKESGEISVLTDFPADKPRTYTIHARIK